MSLKHDRSVTPISNVLMTSHTVYSISAYKKDYHNVVSMMSRSHASDVLGHHFTRIPQIKAQIWDLNKNLRFSWFCCTALVCIDWLIFCQWDLRGYSSLCLCAVFTFVFSDSTAVFHCSHRAVSISLLFLYQHFLCYFPKSYPYVLKKPLALLEECEIF